MLRPLLAPPAHLGAHVKSPTRTKSSPRADRLFESLGKAYSAVAKDPLKLRGHLTTPLEAIPAKLELWPWEYTHEIQEGDTTRPIEIESPTSWILAYESPLNLSQTRAALRGEASQSWPEIRQFVIRALLMKLVFDTSTGLVKLLESLRFRVDNPTTPETGKLTFVRLTSDITVFRPSDSVIRDVTRFSGVSRFQELVQPEGLAELEDPLKQRLLALQES